MATPKTVGCDKTTSLVDINKIVVEQEQLLGPLTGIGNDGNQTQLTFDMDQDPPAKNAVIAPGATVPGGSTKVCTGTIFIASKLTASIATRPS
jgi:hypothetical protein